ncbi:MAG: putative Ig domain-containing protein, partial [Anaerolineae bacterium]
VCEDSDGLTGHDEVLVLVTPEGSALQPPSAHIRSVPVEGDAPLQVELEAVAEDADGSIVATRWALPNDAAADTAGVSIVLSTPGHYTVLLEVEDNDGLLGHDQLTLVVGSQGVRPPRIVSAPQTRALVGVPYRYDADGVPTAQGDRPVLWDLGRVVDGVQLNVPDGMTVSASTGLLSWTPSPAQLGEHRVTLTAHNIAGTDAQDFVLVVEGPPTAPGARSTGCGCAAAEPGCAVLPAAAMPLIWIRRRRRRR